MTDVTTTESTTGSAPSAVQLSLSNPDAVNFFQKYGNDPQKVVESYKHIQERATRAEQRAEMYSPAKDYAIPEGYSFDDRVKNNLLSGARELEMTPRQFQKALEKADAEYKAAAEKAKTSTEQRLVALGGKAGEEELRLHYADVLPPALFDKLIKEASIETLLELKSNKDKSKGTRMTSEMNDPSNALSRLGREQELQAKAWSLANERDKLARKLPPSHPEMQRLENGVTEAYRVLEEHIVNMRKTVDENFGRG